MKRCRKCSKNKLESEFRSASWGGLQSWCKLCESEYQRALYAENPERQRRRRQDYIKRYRDKYNAARRANRLEIYISECSRKYRTTRDTIRKLLGQGKCGICSGTTKLTIDHCHATNQVRGLLCDNCNNLLGRSRDNIATLQNAIKYLRRCSIT